jgi:plastocyanin
MRNRTAIVIGLLVVTLVPVALSAVPAGARRSRTTTLRLAAKPGVTFRFTKRRLTARAGVVRLIMHNPSSSSLPHGIAIEGHHVDKHGRVVSPGGRSSVRARLRRGRYTFYCPFDGHRGLGMRGVLVVRR